MSNNKLSCCLDTCHVLEFLYARSSTSSFQLSERGVIHHSCFEDEKTEDQVS